MSDRKRTLSDLRVPDLRAELEKRNHSKTGVRGVLLQRLSKCLEEEGHDPATFVFEVSSELETPAKKTRRTDSTIEAEQEEAPAMEDMVVQDHVGEDDDVETDKKPEEMEVEENRNTRKRESTDGSECSKAKKVCIEKDQKTEEKTENNTDAEDSINLDIGDDELLNDEADHTAKSKKDEEEASRGQGAVSGGDSTSAAVVKEDGNSDVPVASENSDDKKDTNVSDEKEKEEDKKEKKDEGGPRNLWVSGLSGDTRAKDLKQLCSKHGKVVGAKVVTNAKTPGSRCYGYVTMVSAQDADNCIKNLHRTELHGRLISVEKAKSEAESGARKQIRERRSSKEEIKEEPDSKDESAGEGKIKKDDESSGNMRSASENREKHRERPDARNHRRSREHRRTPQREVLSFSKIWKERDLARARDRSRAAREDERRRRAAEDALRERERRQRQEKHRLELEREKLRAEREKIEREKNELLRLERERHRLEREKLELERLELKRAQLRLEEERRKRNNAYESSSYRKSAPSPPPAPAYERDTRHKRAPPPPMMSSRSQFEAPPPPRFEMTAAYERAPDKREREYKREYPRHVSSASMKYPSNGSSNDDTRQPLPPGTRAKEPSRVYDTRDTRSYRASPPSKPEPRSWNPSSRYPEPSIPSKVTSFNKDRVASGNSEPWSSNTNSSDTRYGSSGYEARYPTQYPPPPTTQYPDRYPQQTRDYRTKY